MNNCPGNVILNILFTEVMKLDKFDNFIRQMQATEPIDQYKSNILKSLQIPDFNIRIVSLLPQCSFSSYI